MDSLMAVELQVRIQREMGVNLPVLNLLNRQSVSDLTRIVCDRLGLNGTPEAAPRPPAAEADAPGRNGNGEAVAVGADPAGVADLAR
jgi:hypothetical protein